MSIELKDTMQKITSRSYSTPRKFHEAWKMLIEQHVTIPYIPHA